MEYDIHSNGDFAIALDLAAITTNTTTVGNVIDTAAFDAIEFVLATGVITDGDYDLIVEHATDVGMSDAETVPAAELLGIATQLSASDLLTRIGYIGGTLADGTFAKRQFLRVSIVSTNTTTGGTMGVLACQRHQKHQPVADQ